MSLTTATVGPRWVDCLQRPLAVTAPETSWVSAVRLLPGGRFLPSAASPITYHYLPPSILSELHFPRLENTRIIWAFIDSIIQVPLRRTRHCARRGGGVRLKQLLPQEACSLVGEGHRRPERRLQCPAYGVGR